MSDEFWSLCCTNRTHTTGVYNTATGLALVQNTTGSYNTAVGSQAPYSVADGIGNVADGWSALRSNQNGWYNVATGAEA